MIYYVKQSGNKNGNGTKENPFSAISYAAEIAIAGDTILVGNGTYHEWVNPKNGGSGNNNRITYKAMEGEKPVITGADRITDWENIGNNIWKASVDNSVFNGNNPYETEISGDWYDDYGHIHHTGEIFLNGIALFEVDQKDYLTKSVSEYYVEDKLFASAPYMNRSLIDPETMNYKWFVEVTEAETVFYGMFNGKNPNEECTEFTVRPYCFFPTKEHRNYITVSGFIMKQAATQWAPPTAFQSGLIGPNWSKGWIIENCDISNSKCAGISLGKRVQDIDNAYSRYNLKDGSQTETEVAFSCLHNGWDKEHIGSHIVRNNRIYSCGQVGIVGNMGSAFCIIENNQIFDINTRNEFHGAENAGIKFHTAIDTIIKGNTIYNCCRGLWLDWEAQGVRVSGNTFFNSLAEDLFIEVSHGPCTVDNNLFLSRRNLQNTSEGTAFIHNLFAGKLDLYSDMGRFTMYHFPHSTKISGFINTAGGDDKFANNLFLNTATTTEYDGYNDILVKDEKSTANNGVTHPIDIHDNIYVNSKGAYKNERNAKTFNIKNAVLDISAENNEYYLNINLDENDFSLGNNLVTTAVLGTSFQTGASYESPDESPIIFDTTFDGKKRDCENIIAGPFLSYNQKIKL